YKTKLDDATSALTSLEVEDVVTVRDVSTVLQRGEMVRQIAAEIETMIIELGVDARLLRLQLDEVFSSLDDELELVMADYPQVGSEPLGGDAGDAAIAPKGLRLLARVPRLSADQAEAITARFGELPRLLRAAPDEIAQVPGVSARLAQAVKDTLDRLTESTILDQYI
ncbi:MAG: hypothetical protein KDB12_03240, partial [Ilumatobacter sp.]|nr:hypothetical protein [Ilumatobacter sp.]